MTHFDQSRARAILARLGLGPLNAQLGDCWLSWWVDGELPRRGAIDPTRLFRVLPGLAVMDIHPDDSVRFRIAGQVFRAGFGFDPTGHDAIALTLKEQRAPRLARFKRTVSGTIATGIRMARRAREADIATQDLVLPLGGRNEDGSQSWIFHSSWRPVPSDWNSAQPDSALGMVEHYTECPLIGSAQ